MTSAGERILIVESDPDISDVIARQALKPLGYDAHIVGEAASAIREALENPPDLIMANLNLPGLSGNDLLTALAAQGVVAPLVVIAEKGDEQRALQALRLGAADALLWPARDAEVVRVVERALQQTRAGRARWQLNRQLDATQQELKRRVRDLTTVLSINKVVTSTTDQPQALGRLLEAALRIAEGDAAWIMLRDDRTKAFLLSAYRHLPPAWAKKINQPLDDGLSSLVALSGQPLTIHGPALEKFKVVGLGRSAAVLPVKIQDELLGVLLVVRKADRDFDRDILALLETVAGLASISVANARLFQTVEAMAQTARLKESSHNAALESLRAAIRDEARVCMYPLETLISGEVGALSQAQRDAVATIQTALKRLARSADRGAGPDGAGSS